MLAEVGDKVKIIEMRGELHYAGKEGIVTSIDSIGQIHGTWGGCAIIPKYDTYVILEKGKKEGVSE